MGCLKSPPPEAGSIRVLRQLCVLHQRPSWRPSSITKTLPSPPHPIPTPCPLSPPPLAHVLGRCYSYTYSTRSSYKNPTPHSPTPLPP
jgi:hypothetical protein